MAERSLCDIAGLAWEPNECVRSNETSFAIMYPITRPMSLVFKGENPFSYGHYGIHLGQEDRLTFVGASNPIKGFFIDCREDSASWGQRFECEFLPDPKQTLVIPPGVAHTFDTHNVFTVNTFKQYLPDPVKWLDKETAWSIDGDVINIPMDIRPDDVPRLEANPFAASENYYQLIAEKQRQTLPNLAHQYPRTEDITFQDGSTKRLKFWKELSSVQKRDQWEPIRGIDGLGWLAHLVVWSGSETGYVPLLFERPAILYQPTPMASEFEINPNADSYLTFFGTKSSEVRVSLVDARSGATSMQNSTELTFNPDILRCLLIPAGVAFKLTLRGEVFIVDCPRALVQASPESYWKRLRYSETMGPCSAASHHAEQPFYEDVASKVLGCLAR